MPQDLPLVDGDSLSLTLLDAVFEGRDFSGLTLSHVALGDGSRFTRCDFSDLRADAGSLGAGFRGAQYLECTFDRARLVNVMPGVSRFVRCSFRDVKIVGFMCQRAEFVECTFSGHLKRAVFDARVLEPDSRLGNGRTRNDYVDNDFGEMKFRDFSFRGGVDLNQQRLPGPPDYVYIAYAEPAIARARRVVREWQDRRERIHAQSYLDVMAENCEDGQRQQLLHRSALGANPAAADRLVTLLTAVE